MGRARGRLPVYVKNRRLHGAWLLAIPFFIVLIVGGGPTPAFADNSPAQGAALLSRGAGLSNGSGELEGAASALSGVDASPQGPGVGSDTFLGSSVLAAGQLMIPGQYLLSPNGLFALVFQADGNVVLYGSYYRPLWSTDTSGSGAALLAMQASGDLVLSTAAGRQVWESATGGNSGSSMAVQNDGNVVVTNAAKVAEWSSSTGGNSIDGTPSGSDRLRDGQSLASGKYLQSADKRFTLLLQSDGNLVLYEPGNRVDWDSGTGGSGAVTLVMQSDGNLVLYAAANQYVWGTGTAGNSGCKAVVQDDGNFVVYNGAGVDRWDSGTGGRGADTTPPVTRATGADARWHRRAVTIRLSAKDSGRAGMIGGSAGTEYRIDKGVWLVGTTVAISAPPSHADDGVHVIDYRSRDAACNVEHARRVTVMIDTAAPTPAALGPRNKACRKGKTMSLPYSIADRKPGCGKARVTIVFYRIPAHGTALYLTQRHLGIKLTNHRYSFAFRCALAKGYYLYMVKATDSAGNVSATSLLYGDPVFRRICRQIKVR